MNSDTYQVYIRNESIYRNLLKTLPDAVVIVDKAGDIIKVNEKASAIFSEERSVMIGKHYTSYLASTLPAMDELFSQQKTMLEGTLVMRRADATEFEAEVSASYIDNEPEGFEVYIVVVRDITEKRRAELEIERSAERYANLIQIMNEGFAVIDRNTLISYVNQEAARITGKKFEDALGTSFYTFLDESGIKRWHEHVYACCEADGSRANFELDLYTDNGVMHTRVSTRNYYGNDGALQGTVAVITDLTKLKDLETRLDSISKEMVDAMFAQLSAREVELLQFLLKGASWPADKRQIAREMDVLPGTLDKFLARIKQKLNLSELEKIVTLAKGKLG